MTQVPNWILLACGLLAAVVAILQLVFNRKDGNIPNWAKRIETFLPILLILGSIGFLFCVYCGLTASGSEMPVSDDEPVEKKVCQRMLKLQQHHFQLYESHVRRTAMDLGWDRHSGRLSKTRRNLLMKDIPDFASQMCERINQLEFVARDFSTMLSAEHPPSHREAFESFESELERLRRWLGDEMTKIDENEDLGLLYDDFFRELRETRERLLGIRIS